MLLTLALVVPAGTSLAIEVDYRRDILPLLLEKCSACHGPIKQEAGLRLDAGKLIHQGGDDGKVISTQSPGKSSLLQRVTSDDVDVRMPPKGQGETLQPNQVQLLTNWITSGATYPADETIPPGPESHWAYQKPVKASLPKIDHAEWSTNPIDSLVFARLRKQGLDPAPRADRRTLVRRVYLDLTGLPPTPTEQHKFLNDNSDDAWLQLVDHLLKQPTHGERWARHWMDVWRYSDWNGYKDQLRGSQRHIWRWRDWIIESLNADRPYDRMIVEMLAGDEVAPADRATLRATGYLARSYHNKNRNIWLDATVEHMAKAFLGMTVNCARCHDHKYDPIAQREYYALRAIFEPHDVRTERVPGQSDLKKAGLARVYDARPQAPTYVYLSGNEKMPDKEHPVLPATPGIVKLPYDPQPIDLPAVAIVPAMRDFHEQEAMAAAREKLKSARDKQAKLGSEGKDVDPLARTIAQQRVELAQAELAATAARWKADKTKFGGGSSDDAFEELATAAWKAEKMAALKNAQLATSQRRQALTKAEAANEKDKNKQKSSIDKAKKELANAEKILANAEQDLNQQGQTSYKSIGKAYPPQSTGRRLALARWITDRNNPLTARVAVNQIWMRHFGAPLVENSFDFGMRSPEPVQRDVLDWLAVDLMENGWNMKRLHRLIVTSRVYQTQSRVDSKLAKNVRSDPDNALLWRANVRRLDAEVIRDSLLHITGSLDMTRGGPDIDFTQGASVARRSLYFRHAYEKQMRMLVAFDAASPNECYRRSESVVPQQALALLNGPLAIEQARILSGKLTKSHQADEAFIRSAFATVLCRDCLPEELTACRQFLVSQTTVLSQPSKLTPFKAKTNVRTQPAGDPSQRARESLVHVLINHNDFVTVR